MKFLTHVKNVSNTFYIVRTLTNNKKIMFTIIYILNVSLRTNSVTIVKTKNSGQTLKLTEREEIKHGVYKFKM